MKIEQFVFNSFQVNNFIVTHNNESILVDAGMVSDFEFTAVENYLKEANSKLVAVVLTHGHIDHIVGCSAIQKKFNVPVYLHEKDLFLLDNAPALAELFAFKWDEKPEVDNVINSEENVTIGSISFDVLHIPGHSPGSMALYFKNDKAIIVGDIIFKGSIGRTDLPGGNYEELIRGIKTKLFVLDQDIQLLPGHGEATSIEQEKNYNPFF